VIAGWLGAATSAGHEGHGHRHAGESAHRHEAQLTTARGVVFHDQNRNGRQDPGEPGVPGVRVSNGGEIVSTDHTGRYEIEVDDDEIIFVIKPRHWATPVDSRNLPQFYYIHKPEGSPAEFDFAGVEPTGPLPESVDFPLYRQAEPDKFRAILFGDTQPRDVTEVEYMTHDVIEQIVANGAHSASFGITLGDIVFDDLDVMGPHNEAVALVGIPWYNVIGNHDLNFDAPNDELSDETFERHYGPSYYSFDYGPTHFLVLDDVTWVAAQGDEEARYYGGLGERQMEFIRNDLAGIPEEQLVVLLMHIPLTGVEDRQELYRLIEQRPATVSISAHTHYMEHRFIGAEDGWRGKEPHHHIVNVTVCGSWWRGKKDERGIPHATMSDGGPNGYSLMEFDGSDFSLEMIPASRPRDYQMLIHAPESVPGGELPTTVVLANVFGGSDRTQCVMRVGARREWAPMQRITVTDPAYLREKAREEKLTNRDWRELPGPHATPHMWRAMLPARLPPGTHIIEVKATSPLHGTYVDQRVIRVTEP
jgi:hypothetical protein